jgi:translocation and assembly module TamB
VSIERRKKHLRRRITSIISWVTGLSLGSLFLFLLAALVGLAIFVRTDFFQQNFQDRVLQIVRQELKAEIQFDSAIVTVFSIEPSISLSNVRFTQAEQEVAVEADRISVGISVFSLPLLAFRQLVISYAEVSGLQYELTDLSVLERWLEVFRPQTSVVPIQFQTSIRRLSLQDSQLLMELPQSNRVPASFRGTVDVDEIDVLLSASDVRVDGRLNLKEFSFGDYGPYDAQVSLTRAVLEDDSLRVRSLSFVHDEDQLELSGLIRNLKDPIFDLKGEAAIDLSYLLNPLGVSGRMQSEFTLQGPRKSVESTGSARVLNGVWREKEFDEIKTEWKLSKNILDVRSLEWSSGAERGKAQLSLPLASEASGSLSLSFQNADLGRYGYLIDNSLKKWQGNFSGELEVQGRLIALEELKLKASVNFEPLEIRSFTSGNEIVIVPWLRLQTDVSAVNQDNVTGVFSMESPAGPWKGDFGITSEGMSLRWTNELDGSQLGTLFTYTMAPLGKLGGRLEGPWSDLVLTVEPQLQNFRLNQQDITNLRGRLIYQDRSLVASPLIADQLSMTGGISFPRVGADIFKQFKFTIRELQFSEVFSFIGLSPEDVLGLSGDLFATGTLSGEVMLPNGSGQLRVDNWSLERSLVPGHSATSRWAASRGVFYLENARVSAASGQKEVQGEASIDTKGFLAVAFRGENLRFSDWALVAGEELPLQGRMKASFDYQRDVPSLVMNLDLTQASIRGVPQENSTIRFQSRGNLGSWTAELFGTRVVNKGRVELLGKRRQIEISADLRDANFAPLIPGLQDSRFEVLMSGKGTLNLAQPVDRDPPRLLLGMFSAPTQVSGGLDFNRAEVSRSGEIIHSVRPSRIVFSKGESQLLRLSTSAPFVIDTGPRRMEVSGFYENLEVIDLTLRGDTNLSLAAAFNPVLARSDGLLSIDARLRPDGLAGQLEIVDGLLTFQNSSMVARDVSALLRARGSVVEVVRLEGAFREGTISAQGRLELTTRTLDGVDMQISLNQVLMQPESGVSARLSGPLSVRAQGADGLVKGRLVVSDGIYRKRIDLRSDIVSGLQGGRRTFRPRDHQDAIWKSWGLDVQVVTQESFGIRNNLGEGSLNLNLSIAGTIKEPRIRGSADIARGQFSYNSRQFTIRSGSILFQNPDSNIPNYDIRAETDISDYTINMRLQGSAEEQRILYTSDPALPEKDILSLIQFGLPASADELQNQDQTRSLGLTGLSFVTGGIQDQIESRLSRDLGIQRFQVSPAFFEQTGRTELQFTVGTDIIRNRLSVNYSNFLSASGGHKVELEFRVNRTISLIGSWRDVRDEEGTIAQSSDDFGGDIRFRFEFE